MKQITSLMVAMVAALALGGLGSVGCVEGQAPEDDDVVVVDDNNDNDAGTVVVNDEQDGGVQGPALAAFDNDSQQDPARDEFLRITGNRELVHTDEISFPEGDQQDFVRFELPNGSNPDQRVKITLDCAIDGQSDAIVRAFITEDGQTVDMVTCNEGVVNVTIDNTKVQDVRIGFASVNAPSYVDYTLTIAPF